MLYYVNDRILARNHLFPFLMDSRWQPTENLQEADVLPLMCHTDSKEVDKQRQELIAQGLETFSGTSLIMSVYYADESKDSFDFVNTSLDVIYSWLKETKLYVHTNQGLIHDRALFWDILLSRCQAMFAHHRWDLLGTHWLEHAESELFSLTEIPITKQLKKTFVIPNRIYPNNNSDRMYFRRKLDKLCRHRLDQKAYFTKENNDLPAESGNHITRRALNNRSSSIWQPIANSLYNASLCSAYVETVSLGPNRVITEKTWDPLVKGHFILPFSYPQIQHDLAGFGIKFPDFIRYDYLEIDNALKRWDRFQQEILRLGNIPLHELETEYEKNQSLLEQNRHKILTADVARLYDRVKSCFL